MILPHFIPGIHYTRQPRLGWEYTTLRDIVIPLPDIRKFPDVAFADRFRKVWMTIEGNQLTIRAGYSWNGSSFAFDTRSNLLASLVHDALYQFSGAPNFPLSRDEADLIYLGILRGARFWLAPLYYSAIRKFGCTFWQFSDGETMRPL